MLDIRFIRANAELVKAAVANKNEKADIDTILVWDDKRRKLQFDFDTLKARQNQVSTEIATLKRAKVDAS